MIHEYKKGVSEEYSTVDGGTLAPPYTVSKVAITILFWIRSDARFPLPTVELRFHI